LKAARRPQAAAAIVPGKTVELYVSSACLGALALETNLPLIGSYRDFGAAGGLMYYRLDARDAMRQRTCFIDRVQKGAKASERPFERSTRVKLVVDLKTAKALGLTVREPILLRADPLIQ
jgi:putative ABC transport system substrate-binding protein